jgi:hypothetical protein
LFVVPTALPGSPFAYGIAVANTVANPPLARLDVATGQETLGPTLPDASEFFALGSSMAIVSPAHEKAGRVTGPWSLRLVEGASTSLDPPRVLSFLRLPYRLDVTNGPAIGQDDFWIGSGSSLFLVNASTAKVVRHKSFGVEISSISVDPTGSLLYVALDELNKKGLVRAHAPAPVVVEELNAKTGHVLDHAGTIGALGSAALEAVLGGVWVSARGGMAGTAVLLRAGGLAMVKPPTGSTSFNDSIPTMGASITMGIETAYISSTVWLAAADGLSCVAPSTGTFQGGTTFGAMGFFWSPFTEWQGRLYLYAGVQTSTNTFPGILSVTPPSDC